jgi:hypothetical protein
MAWLQSLLHSNGLGKYGLKARDKQVPVKKLCKICDFNGSDYEECRLLAYTYPVRGSQETYYLSA